MNALSNNFKYICIFWICVAFLYLLLTSDYCDLSQENCSLLPPNEMGDFLAGFFAPLAFIGLMITIHNQKNDTQNLLEIERERNKSTDPFFIWIFKDITKDTDYDHESDTVYEYYNFNFELVNIRGLATTTKIFVKSLHNRWYQLGREIFLLEKNKVTKVNFRIDTSECETNNANQEVKIECISEMGRSVLFYYNLKVTDYREEYNSADGFDAKITLNNQAEN